MKKIVLLTFPLMLLGCSASMHAANKTLKELTELIKNKKISLNDISLISKVAINRVAINIEGLKSAFSIENVWKNVEEQFTTNNSPNNKIIIEILIKKALSPNSKIKEILPPLVKDKEIKQILNNVQKEYGNFKEIETPKKVTIQAPKPNNTEVALNAIKNNNPTTFATTLKALSSECDLSTDTTLTKKLANAIMELKDFAQREAFFDTIHQKCPDAAQNLYRHLDNEDDSPSLEQRAVDTDNVALLEQLWQAFIWKYENGTNEQEIQTFVQNLALKNASDTLFNALITITEKSSALIQKNVDPLTHFKLAIEEKDVDLFKYFWNKIVSSYDLNSSAIENIEMLAQIALSAESSDEICQAFYDITRDCSPEFNKIVQEFINNNATTLSEKATDLKFYDQAPAEVLQLDHTAEIQKDLIHKFVENRLNNVANKQATKQEIHNFVVNITNKLQDKNTPKNNLFENYKKDLLNPRGCLGIKQDLEVLRKKNFNVKTLIEEAVISNSNHLINVIDYLVETAKLDGIPDLAINAAVEHKDLKTAWKIINKQSSLDTVSPESLNAFLELATSAKTFEGHSSNLFEKFKTLPSLLKTAIEKNLSRLAHSALNAQLQSNIACKETTIISLLKVADTSMDDALLDYIVNKYGVEQNIFKKAELSKKFRESFSKTIETLAHQNLENNVKNGNLTAIKDIVNYIGFTSATTGNALGLAATHGKTEIAAFLISRVLNQAQFLNPNLKSVWRKILTNLNKIAAENNHGNLATDFLKASNDPQLS
ncbi:TPA: hypothetical protein DDZ86_02725 [Candidatus Dependentiae bacterium]|nr:MAG: hypothetical protein UW09_C0001G0103 [candidate division TM6 bacterium GW2011_GWF2_43_87]HBL98533.1 hypothetical protein [Candidatus Dependentiae bacterium]